MAIAEDLIRLNTAFVRTLRDLAVEDPAVAAVKFGIPRQDVDLLVAIPLDALERLALYCDRPLMTLSCSVHRLADLVAAPGPVASLMVASARVERTPRATPSDRRC